MSNLSEGIDKLHGINLSTSKQGDVKLIEILTTGVSQTGRPECNWRIPKTQGLPLMSV